MMKARVEKVRLGAAIFIVERAYGKAIARTEAERSPLEEAATDYLVAALKEAKVLKAQQQLQASAKVVNP